MLQLMLMTKITDSLYFKSDGSVKHILFFFDNITYRRAIEEREIKYHFISRCSKGTPLAQRAIKLTLLTAHYFIAR